MKHTPGPWLISTTSEIESGDAWVVCKLDKLCVIVDDDNAPEPSFWPSEHEQEDAHLIAAAPDLLAACELVLIELEKIPWHSSIRAITGHMRAVVEKARGE
jgi:hypothetical protein